MAMMNIILNWNGKEVYKELSGLLVRLDVKEHLEGKAGSIEIEFINKNNLFLNDWHPKNNDTIELLIADNNGNQYHLGNYWIDELEFSGDRQNGALARVKELSGKASIFNAHVNKQYEGVVFGELVRKIAGECGYAVKGELGNEQVSFFDTKKQNVLGVLMMLSRTYGYVFKVDNNELWFYQYEKLKQKESIKIKPDNIINYQLCSSAISLYNSCTVKWYDHTKKTSYSGKHTTGKGGTDAVIWESVKDNEDAQKTAKSWIENKSKNTTSVKLSLIGDARMYSGSPISIEGFGVYDKKKYLIESVEHRIIRNDFTTEINIVEC